MATEAARRPPRVHGKKKEAPRAFQSGTCQPQKDRLYKKGTRTSAANRHSGWHGAVSAPVHGYHLGTIFYDPDPFPLGRGQLLSGVRRHQQNQSHSDKQSVKERPHGCTLPFTVCAVPTRRDKEGNRAEGSVAEQRTKGNFLLYAFFHWHRHIHNVIDHAGCAVHGLVSKMRITLRHFWRGVRHQVLQRIEIDLPAACDAGSEVVAQPMNGTEVF